MENNKYIKNKSNKINQRNFNYCLYCDKTGHNIQYCSNFYTYNIKTAKDKIVNNIQFNAKILLQDHKNYTTKCYFCKIWGHKTEFCRFLILKIKQKKMAPLNKIYS